MRLFRYFLLLILSSLMLYFGACKLIVNKALQLEHLCSKPNRSLNTPARFYMHDSRDTALPVATQARWFTGEQEVSFLSLDQRTHLSGWVRKTPGARNWVLLIHGHSSCKKDAHVLQVAGMLIQQGFSVMLLDLREHGNSQRQYHKHSAGKYESEDVIAAWKWLQINEQVPAERIGIYGTSFGAGVTSIAFAKEPNIQAVWLDAPYANMPKIIRGELAHKGLPSWLDSLAIQGAQLFEDLDLISLSPEHNIQSVGTRAVAISYYTHDARTPKIHGEIMCQQAHKHATFPDKILCKQLDQGIETSFKTTEFHSVGPFVDPKWGDELAHFFNTHLGKPPQ